MIAAACTSSFVPPELIEVETTAARVQEFPATLVTRSLLGDGRTAHGAEVTEHIVTGWTQQLANNLAAFPPARTACLQSIRERMVDELAALRQLGQALHKLRLALPS